MFDRSLVTESRFASALKKELTPLELSSENQSGRFVGSEGNIYQTTLDSCTCADFAIQGYAQPCKHMLRLAMAFQAQERFLTRKRSRPDIILVKLGSLSMWQRCQR